MTTAVFSSPHPWALLPQPSEQPRPNEPDDHEFGAHFRFTGRQRVAEDCGPWRMGRALGWVVPSPVNVTLTPLDDVAVDLVDADEAADLGSVLGHDYQLWHRRASTIAVRRNSWLRLHQFRGADGQWQGMFLPNGQGTVEWRMGWKAQIDEGHFMIVLPIDSEHRFEVPTGVLSHKQLERMAGQGGVSIPLRPLTNVHLRRGDPIARALVVDASALRH